jgi:hypothetical protein
MGCGRGALCFEMTPHKKNDGSGGGQGAARSLFLLLQDTTSPWDSLDLLPESMT